MDSSVASCPEPDRSTRRQVEAAVSAAGSSFFWAMRLLPADKRAAVFAVYAFCREVDDIADGEAPPEDKRQALAAWREEIARLYAGAPTRPIGRALLPVVRRYGLRRADFEALIEGMESDALAPLVAPSRAELDRYCDRVASAPGRLCVRIFGEPGAKGEGAARWLGRALQLTNILRDLREDAARGRLYLPSELLHAHGIESHDPEAVLRHPALPAACRDLAAEATAAFAEAEAVIGACSPQAMRPAVVMMMIYRRTLERLLARGWRGEALDPPGRLARLVQRAEKLCIAARYGVFGR